ncbi:hypothetical protein F2Q68_00032279 [Brassica cretica]|uniref:Uncharacterized protein n=1 Tax=Brassica cretica TaxID=69181 RepID=A0A8S9GA70_BRACR|nr:hypothetical protein F2Q68_00032279 [Brassica cretica]
MISWSSVSTSLQCTHDTNADFTCFAYKLLYKYHVSVTKFLQLFVVHVGLLTLSHIIYACDAPEIIPYSFSCIKLESHDEFLQLSTLTTVVVTPDRRPYFSSESIHLEFSTQTSLTIPLRITTSRNNLFNLIPPAHFSLPLTRIFKLSLTLNRLFPLGFYTLCPCSSCFFVEVQPILATLTCLKLQPGQVCKFFPLAFELRFLSESSTLTTVVVTSDRRPYFSSESIHLEFLTQTSLTIPLSRNNLFNLIPPAHFSLPLTRIFKLSLTLNRLFPLGFYTLCPCSSCFFVETGVPYSSSESIHLEFLTQTSTTIPLRITTSRNNLFNPIPPAHFSLPLTRIFKLSLT